jgi:hypothetical protein
MCMHTAKDHLVTLPCAHARQRATWHAPVLPGGLCRACLWVAHGKPWSWAHGEEARTAEARCTAELWRTAEMQAARQRMPARQRRHVHGKGGRTAEAARRTTKSPAHGKVFAIRVWQDARQRRRCWAYRCRARFALRRRIDPFAVQLPRTAKRGFPVVLPI